MARKSKLLAALDAHRGRDVKQERQKRQEKMARKRAGVKIAPGKRAAPDGVDPGAAQEFPYVPEDSSTDTPMDSLQVRPTRSTSRLNPHTCTADALADILRYAFPRSQVRAK